MTDLEYKYGIVQGRLTVPPNNELQWFPKGCWREEFCVAKEIGFDFIELIDEREYNADNPIWSKTGRLEIIETAKRYKQKNYSICCDYIINHALHEDPFKKTADHLHKFFETAIELGCEIAILPLLEKSDLNTKSSERMLPILKSLSQSVSGSGIIICLETLMEGKELNNFLQEINEEDIKCVFDTGNRVIKNKNIFEEISVLSNWIKHVHLKDKNELGQNVILGTGLVNFYDIFKELKKISYNGSLAFETTRGIYPEKTATFHLEMCKFLAEEVSSVK